MVEAFPLVAAGIISYPMYLVLRATQSTVKPQSWMDSHNARDRCSLCVLFISGLVCGLAISRVVAWSQPDRRLLVLFDNHEVARYQPNAAAPPKPALHVPMDLDLVPPPIYAEDDDASSIHTANMSLDSELAGEAEDPGATRTEPGVLDGVVNTIAAGPDRLNPADDLRSTPPPHSNNLLHSRTTPDRTTKQRTLSRQESAGVPHFNSRPHGNPPCGQTYPEVVARRPIEPLGATRRSYDVPEFIARSYAPAEMPGMVIYSTPNVLGSVINLPRVIPPGPVRTRNPSYLGVPLGQSSVADPQPASGKEEARDQPGRDGDNEPGKKKRRRSKASQAGQMRRAIEYQAMKKLVNDLVDDDE